VKINVFEDLRAALEGALAYERGQPGRFRVTVFPPAPSQLSPKQIKRIRHSLRVSQRDFARILNVSSNTVESWEQGARRPQQAALKLLEIARTRPDVLLRPAGDQRRRKRQPSDRAA
jgi:DNA-binding transcriptional regulator YiaG